MPAPSQVSAANVNFELGVSNTASVNLNSTEVRNLACKPTGAISFGDCRWGINIPGGSYVFTTVKQYNTSNSADLFDTQLVFYDPPITTSVSSFVEIYFELTAGRLQFVTKNGGSVRSVTWLTSGANSDYTIRFNNFGPDALTSGTANTDLTLNTFRAWNLTATQNNLGLTTKFINGELVLKDAGGTLITRPVTMDVTAEVSL